MLVVIFASASWAAYEELEHHYEREFMHVRYQADQDFRHMQYELNYPRGRASWFWKWSPSGVVENDPRPGEKGG